MKRTSLSWITVIPFCNSNEYTAASFTDWKLFVPGLFAVYQMGCKMQTTFLYGVLSFTCGGQTTFLHHSELHLRVFPAARSFIWVTSRPLAALGRKKTEQKADFCAPPCSPWKSEQALPRNVGHRKWDSGGHRAHSPGAGQRARGVSCWICSLLCHPSFSVADKTLLVSMWLTLAHGCVFPNVTRCEICHVCFLHWPLTHCSCLVS